MRITILQGAFFPVPPLRGSATEKLWFELGKQFSQHGHVVCHVSRSFPGLPQQEVIEGVHHYRVRGYDATPNQFRLKFLDLVYSLRAMEVLPPADILITNTFWSPILAALSQRRLGRTMVSVERMPKGQMRIYWRSACLRAPSKVVQQAITREVPWMVDRIRTIPNPLPFLPPPVTNEERQSVILFCGRLNPEKGIELLIKAFSKACAEGLSGWSLRLVGSAETAIGGGGLPWLQTLLQSPIAAGLPIQWLGPIYDQQQLISHYRQAAIFVYPSLAEQGETFGLAPLEAMACGAVPIVSNLSCFRDYITPGVSGLVFNHRASNAPTLLAAQILQLANNHDQRALMAQAALAVRHSHHPATIASEFLQCFEELLQQRPNA